MYVCVCMSSALLLLLCRFVKQDQVVIARLQTAGIICLETFKEFPQMARFTLRDEGECCQNGLDNAFEAAVPVSNGQFGVQIQDQFYRPHSFKPE